MAKWWCVIEQSVSGTIRNAYTVPEDKLKEVTERQAAELCGRPLTDNERRTLEDECRIVVNGRVYQFCALKVDEPTDGPFQIWASVPQPGGTFADEMIGTATAKGLAFAFAKGVQHLYPQVTVRHKNEAGLDVIDFTFDRPEPPAVDPEVRNVLRGNAPDGHELEPFDPI